MVLLSPGVAFKHNDVMKAALYSLLSFLPEALSPLAWGCVWAWRQRQWGWRFHVTVSCLPGRHRSTHGEGLVGWAGTGVCFWAIVLARGGGVGAILLGADLLSPGEDPCVGGYCTCTCLFSQVVEEMCFYFSKMFFLTHGLKMKMMVDRGEHQIKNKAPSCLSREQRSLRCKYWILSFSPLRFYFPHFSFIARIMVSWAVGTTNKAKIESVVSVVNKCFPNDKHTVTPISVPSGVSNQPMSAEETTEGAINRAKRAGELVEGSDFGVGLEGGLECINGRWYECGWMCVYQKSTGRTGIGSSARFEMSSVLMSPILNEGKELAEVMDSLTGKEDVRSGLGAMGVLTDGHLPRGPAYEHGLMFALAPFLSDEKYWK